MRTPYYYRSHIGLYDLSYFSFFTALLTKKLISSGKTMCINSLIKNLFTYIYQKTKQSPILIFEKACLRLYINLKNVLHFINNELYYTFFLTTEVRALRLAITWLLHSVKKTKKEHFTVALAKTIIETAANTSSSIKLFSSYKRIINRENLESILTNELEKNDCFDMEENLYFDEWSEFYQLDPITE